MSSEKEVNGSVLDELQRLDEVVADLRAQVGVEGSELRARVRELERRLEQLTVSPPRTGSTARVQKPPKAERAAGKEKPTKAERAAERAAGNEQSTKAERAAAKQARAARRGPDGPPQQDDEADQPT